MIRKKKGSLYICTFKFSSFLKTNNLHFPGKALTNLSSKVWLVRIYRYNKQFFIPLKCKSYYNYSGYNRLFDWGQHSVNMSTCYHYFFYLYSHDMAEILLKLVLNTNQSISYLHMSLSNIN